MLYNNYNFVIITMNLKILINNSEYNYENLRTCCVWAVSKENKNSLYEEKKFVDKN